MTVCDTADLPHVSVLMNTLAHEVHHRLSNGVAIFRIDLVETQPQLQRLLFVFCTFPLAFCNFPFSWTTLWARLLGSECWRKRETKQAKLSVFLNRFFFLRLAAVLQLSLSTIVIVWLWVLWSFLKIHLITFV